MSHILFLDDERTPPWWLGHDPMVARDLTEFQLAFHLYGVPGVISLDHDLGKFESGELKPNGLQCLKWMIEQHLDGTIDLLPMAQVIVHSNNPAGAQNIVGLWNGFAKTIGSDVVARWRAA